MAPQGDIGLSRYHPWTIVHSYYAAMGGFAIDTSIEKSNFLPENRARLTLTPDGILFLAKKEPALIPDLSEEDISDKSKASGLAKAIVCLQTFWFCTQCV